MTHRIRRVMHSSTHLNSPIHLIQKGEGVGELDIQKFFGVGAVIFVPKKKWELVTVSDLKSATPKVRSGDIVIIVTGWHTKYSDSLEYFGDSPGLSIPITCCRNSCQYSDCHWLYVTGPFRLLQSRIVPATVPSFPSKCSG